MLAPLGYGGALFTHTPAVQILGGAAGLALLYFSGNAYPNGTSGDPKWNRVFYANLIAHLLTLGTGLLSAFDNMGNPIEPEPAPENLCDPTVEVCLDPVAMSRFTDLL